jgi:hypothetical protein
MRAWIIALGLLLATVTAEAATITITTTPEQDVALVTLLTKLNAERKAPLLPLTAKEFRDYIVAQWLDGLVSQAGEQNKTTIREGWEKADQAKRDQVKTILGVQ